MRTQQVDKIAIASSELDCPVIEIWTSPIVERKYERKLPAIAKTGVRKPRKDDHTCACHHLRDDHAWNSGKGSICLIPACGCKEYQPLERVSLPAAPLSDLFEEEEGENQ